MSDRRVILAIVGGAILIAGAILYKDSASLPRLFESAERREIRTHFNDPSSAMFRNTFSNGRNVCGQVNARNRLGAYVGWQEFIYVNYSSSNSTLFLAQNHGLGWGQMWVETCELDS